MRVPDILFWVIIGVLVGTLFILIANEMLVNVLKVNVQFNSENPQQTQNIDCSPYGAEKDCKDAGCKWCARCSSSNIFKMVNQWDADKCIDIKEDCSYYCKMGECNAECDSSGGCQQTQHCNLITCLCE